jgi:outer membrane protein OmpA-like peptidoglycan-associated protein
MGSVMPRLIRLLLIPFLILTSSFVYAASISGVVNKYVKGKGDVTAGANQVVVTGSVLPTGHTFTAGEQVLLIQSQGASIDASNTDKYGNGVGTGGDPSNVETSPHGSTEYAGGVISQIAGTFEYAEVLSISGSAPGDVTITLQAELKNAFYDRNEANWQLVLVPDYGLDGVSLSNNVEALPWNGDLGGIVAFSATGGNIEFAGNTVDAAAKGFRGGVESNYQETTDSIASVVSNGASYEGGKGEGIAGTPRYVFDGSTTDYGVNKTAIGDTRWGIPAPRDQALLGVINNGVSTLVGGDYGRGAPGNAGGGAGPHNSGGGGGSNAGQGGEGAQGWVGGTPKFYAGYGGQSVFAGLNMGGGGGSGEANNRSLTHGGVGGGVVLIKAASASGIGSVDVSGGNGYNDNNSDGDGAGGGGAAGTAVLYFTNNSVNDDLTVIATGGSGAQGDANHGSGGGGGGGYVIANTLSAGKVNVAGGNAGTNKGVDGQGATQGGTGLAQTGSQAFIILNTDYGDAPASYGTESGANAAYHQFADYDFDGVIGNTEKIYLGLLLDGESGGIPSGGANSDDNDQLADEDGINLVGLSTTDTRYTIPAANIQVTNTYSSTATLHAWLDFDGNGTFDADEYTSASVPSGIEQGTLSQDLAWSSTPGLSELFSGYPVYARFRLSTDSSLDASSARGSAVTGEVEDYVIALNNATYTVIDEHLFFVDSDQAIGSSLGTVTGSGALPPSWTINGGNDLGLFALDTDGNLTAAEAVSFANQNSYVLAAVDSNTSPGTFTKVSIVIRRIELNLSQAYIGNQIQVSTDTMLLDPEVSVSYQWHRDGVAISAATNNHYTVAAGDLNASLTLVGTYKNSAGITIATVTSAAVAVVADSAAIDKIKAYADDQSQPVPSEEDYEAAGINPVDIKPTNLALVNQVVATKTSVEVDTAAKIQAIVDAVNKLQVYLDDSASPKTAPKPTANELILLGLKDITAENLDQVLAKLDDPATDVSSLSKMQAAVNEVNAAIAQAAALEKIQQYATSNGSTSAPSLEDYQDVDVSNVSAEVIDRINAAIAALIAADVDSQAEIQAIVDQVIADIAKESAIAKISAYAADQTQALTTADYSAADITGVDSANLARVNAAIAALNPADVDTQAEIQRVIEQVIADIAQEAAITKISTYAGDQTNVPTSADYATSGVTGVDGTNLDRVNAAIAALNPADVDSKEKIQTLVDQVIAQIAEENAIIKISNYADDQTTALTSDDFTAAGVTGVDAGNIDRVNAAIAALNPQDVDTKAEIQALVEQVLAQIANENAIAKISAYAGDQTQPVPNEADYSAAEVTGVGAENVARVNAAIAALNPADVDTKAEIQAIVDQVIADIAKESAIAKISAYAADQTQALTTADYSAADITGVDSANLARVNAAIAALNPADVDTQAEIQRVIEQVIADIAQEAAITKISTYAGDQTNVPTSADYATSGVTGVDGTNLDRVNAAIAALNPADVDSKEKIQTLVNQVLAQIAAENAIEKIDTYADDQTHVPTPFDYAIAGITGVDSNNLEKINAAVAAMNTGELDSKEKIQQLVNQVIAELNALNELVEDLKGNANGNLITAAQLNDIPGVTGLNAANLEDYHTAFVASPSPFADINNPKAAEINAVIAQVNTANVNKTNALNKIQNYAGSNGDGSEPAPTEQDFLHAGVTNVDANLIKINQAIAASSPDAVNTRAKVQALVDAINSGAIDSDKDGLPDVIDQDDDNDGLADTDETDEGRLNPDQDNDGICDGNLAVANVCSAGPDANPTNPDSDGNGICDGAKAVASNESFNGCMPNSNPDPDADTDNDGIKDINEAAGDSDGDLIPDYLDPQGDGPAPAYGDSDNDGINDKDECGPELPCRDSDNDGIYDYLDTDSDNDGISDDEEADGIPGNGGEGTNPALDSDGDGIPNYRDSDSDNDGTPDSEEVDQPHDENNPRDSDGDSIPDVIDHDDGSSNGGNGGELGGGDSDHDGLTDAQECPSYPTNCPDSDGDGRPDYLDNDNDSDGDGIPDGDEDSNQDGDNNPATNPRDSDGDGTPDYLDDDADNDGRLDQDERDQPFDPNNPRDTDNDGIPDVVDAHDGSPGSVNEGAGAGDSDNDGIPDNLECGTQPCRDTDNDGIPDYADTDSDNDGINDGDEVGENPAQPQDTDGDGIPDIADKVNGAEGTKGGDSDGDGVADSDECPSWPNCIDTDRDGIADYLDSDSSPVGTSPSPAPEVDLGTIKTGVHGAGNMPFYLLAVLMLLALVRRQSAKLLALPLIMSSLTANSAWWDEMDLYAGAGFGQSYLSPAVGGTQYSIDDHTQDAWKLSAGWDWNDHISIEGYYSQLGSVELNPGGELGYRMLGGNAMLHYWARGGERVKGSIALYAKAGLNHMTNDGEGIRYESKNQGQLFGAIGAELYLPKKFSVRFEIDSYDTDASLFSLNIIKRFGFKSRTPSLPPLPIVEKETQQEEFVAMVEELPATAAGPKVVQLAPVVLDTDQDGLLDDEDQCPYTPKGVSINELGCATYHGKIGDLIANVQFEVNSASLTEPSKIALDEIVDMLATYVAVKIEVQAHSDNTGSATYNKKLSQKRAESVVEYLAEKQIAKDRLAPLGFGEEKPIADNNTAQGRAENRRVEFILKAR